MKLVWPPIEHLPADMAALERGWSPDNVRGDAAAREELEKIAADPAGVKTGLRYRIPLVPGCHAHDPGIDPRS